MQMYVVIHIQGGILKAVRTFATPEAAAECEKQWCDNLGIPFEEKTREEYYEENEVDDDILSETTTLETTQLAYCLKCAGPLELVKFVETWDPKGQPMDIVQDASCPKCGLRYSWPPEEIESEFMLKNWEPSKHQSKRGIASSHIS